jgi:hypothetical protein
MPVKDIHAHTFAKSSILSSYQMPKVILPIDVIRVLNRAKISFVLVGAYGLAGWRRETRSTDDVDVIVAGRQVKKAVRMLLEAFPQLEPVDLPVVVRLRERDTEDVMIDVMKPVQQPYTAVFKHTYKLDAEGESYRVPSLEMAVVMKFSAMLSTTRAPEDRHRDAYDFMRIVKNNPDLNLDQAAELASAMYPDGGKKLRELTRKTLANETLVL